MFQSIDHNLYAVTPDNTQLWNFDLGGPSDALTSIGSDGTVYSCPTPAGKFFALDSQGHKKWDFRTAGNAPMSAPLPSIDGQTIYFLSGDSSANGCSLYALRSDGSMKWKYTPPLNDLNSYSPAMSPDGSTLYCPGVGSGGAPLYAIDTGGVVVWRYFAQGLGPCTVTEPCVDNRGNIFFACDQSLLSIDHFGALRWQINNLSLARFDVGPVIGWDGCIYIAGQLLYAFDNFGTWIWSRPIPPSNCIPAVDREGTIYLGSSRAGADTNNFYAFNYDGSLKFRLALRNASGARVDVTSRPAISDDGHIYVGCDSPQGHRLFKIR